VDRDLRLAAVVLAAGAGTRFGAEPGSKLLAEVGGRPLLVQVLEVVRQFAPVATVVVLGHGAARIEESIDWAGELRIRNHDPDRGLASSLQIGIDALRALPGSLDGAFIILGDQPALRADVLRALADAAVRARPADRPAVVPRYDAAEGARNPVLLLRPAWSWVDDLEGDRGLAPTMAQRPDALLEVPVPGTMPDVDTPGDLERLQGPGGAR
jgi:molybdenum cofactor cytidylyltransferase